jgi:hypothetical protein
MPPAHNAVEEEETEYGDSLVVVEVVALPVNVARPGYTLVVDQGRNLVVVERSL